MPLSYGMFDQAMDIFPDLVTFSTPGKNKNKNKNLYLLFCGPQIAQRFTNGWISDPQVALTTLTNSKNRTTHDHMGILQKNETASEMII